MLGCPHNCLNSFQTIDGPRSPRQDWTVFNQRLALCKRAGTSTIRATLSMLSTTAGAGRPRVPSAAWSRSTFGPRKSGCIESQHARERTTRSRPDESISIGISVPVITSISHRRLPHRHAACSPKRSCRTGHRESSLASPARWGRRCSDPRTCRAPRSS